MRRYRIFISSTIDDLQEARTSVFDKLNNSDIFEAIRVENMPAVDEPSRQVCLKEVADSDAIVLILSSRYGFVPEINNPKNLSVTHLEYNEAKRLKRPVFAFLQEGVSPEKKLLDFIQEVSNFEEGVFRKKWQTAEQLSNEVSRSLVYWLGRRAIDSQSSQMYEQYTAQMANYPEFGKFPLLFYTEETVDDNLKSWNDSVADHLSLECKRRHIPVPCQLDEYEEGSKPLGVSLRISPSNQISRLIVIISLYKTDDTSSSTSMPLPPIEVDVAKTNEGARFVAHTCLSLVYVTVDDWSRSIDQLFASAENRNATDNTRSRIVGTAAYISAFKQGQRSSDVVKHLLTLSKLDEQTVSAGIMALTSAELRFENAKAHHALTETRQLAFRLLTEALSRKQASSESLYNLAREALKHCSRAALKFYEQLLRSDHTYDERWYFHRDIGLIYYALSQYKDASLHYERACHLKNNDSELFRFAGDALYYQGLWAGALMNYEKAVEIEPIEQFFLDGKIEFARGKIRKGLDKDRKLERNRTVSLWISRIAEKTLKSQIDWIAKPLFSVAKKICSLNFDADRGLALYANRIGHYESAIGYLKDALTVIPENPATRLHLVLNLIFKNDGILVDEAREHLEIAIFHGGPQTRELFRLQLSNTKNRDQLCEEFDRVFNIVKQKREEWRERRNIVLKPEQFGRTTHFEFRE